MLKILLVSLLIMLQPAMAAETSGDVMQAGMVNPGFHEKPDWFKQSFLDIREDIAEAAQQDRRVLLYFYQDGCPYCKKLLETNFGLRDITDRTRKYFDVIAINMWGDREVTDLDGNSITEKQFATDLKVMFTPTLLFLDEQGKVLVRLNGYYPPHRFGAVVDFVGQHREKEGSFRDYWAKLSPVAAKGVLHQDESYLQAPYRLAERRSDKPLLVLFEQKDCVNCDELHLDILQRKESVSLLKGFDVVLLDMWSETPVQTPAGAQSTAAKWSKQLGVQYAPTLIMFDAGGQEVFRTDAYLKAFHIQSAMDYVLSGAYREQPSFQRYIQTRADALEAQGVHVDLMQ
ncbi:MAG TPA: thioredoxin [Gammaproteobacteria bacterium]|nr:thioredoxin [Gammaproteobacteria bacterium]